MSLSAIDCKASSSMIKILPTPALDSESLRRTEKVFAKRIAHEADYGQIVSATVFSLLTILDLTNLVTSYLPRADIFGIDAWETFFGVDVGVEPSLPKDIDHILQSPSNIDPTMPNRTVADDFMLVLIPKELTQIVKGKKIKVPFSLNSLGKLVQNLKSPTKYGYFLNVAQDQYGAVSDHNSHWVLMSRDILPGSRNKSYVAQKAQVATFSEQTHVPYEVPTALEAATCIFAEYARTGTRLYDDKPWSYTRCQESIRGQQLIVGSFASGGLDVSNNFANISFGVAVVRNVSKALGT